MNLVLKRTTEIDDTAEWVNRNMKEEACVPLEAGDSAGAPLRPMRSSCRR